MLLNIFTDFCAYWWLAWLLPFLLGLLLGWLIWGRWIRIVKSLEDDLAKVRSQNRDLEKSLSECNDKNKLLTSENRNYSHQLSTAITEIKSLKAKDVQANNSIIEENAKTESSSQSEAPITSGKYAKVGDDNLQIIEGIGPKMESILKENNVKNHNALSNTDATQLRNILDKYGDKYKIINPEDWTYQASLANDQKWDKLISFQKADGSESKAEKIFIKMGIIKAYKDNDLKAIEGIGPKISELLIDHGISTWQALANATESKLKDILDSQGSKYKLADPSTWPTQAKMASEGDWDKLEEYQSQLNRRNKD